MKNVCKFLSLIFCIVLLIPITGCKKKYTVIFKDYDGTLLKEEIVKKGDNAIAPKDPTREGYNFIGWDKVFSKVVENLTIFAKYEKENVHEYTITFEPALPDNLNPITVVYNNEYEDNYWKNLEENGFVSHTTLKEKYDAKYNKEISETQISDNLIPSASYVAPFKNTDDDITKLQSARFEVELKYIYKTITTNPDFIETDEFNDTYLKVSKKLSGVTRYDYLDNLSNELILSNDKYELYFNFINTQFVLKEKDGNGDIINSWTSNPKNFDANNKAIFVITCLDDSKDTTENTIEYDSYSYSCFENIDKVISPSFSVNVVKNSNGNAEKIIVYYTLEQKGIDSTYIPNKISLPRMRELIQRCNKLVAEYKTQNNGEYPIDSSGRIITELGFLNEIIGNNPATGKPFEKSTLMLYSKVVDMCYIRKELDSNYKELPLEEQYFELIHSPSQASIAECYRFFYEWCGYTVDELFIDTGVEKEIPTSPIVNVAIEYKLGENGLEIMIPNNSVKTNKNDEGDYYIVTSINLLPYIIILE